MRKKIVKALLLIPATLVLLLSTLALSGCATAQNYNIIAMALFLMSRFISTFLMKYVNTRVLLSIFAVGAGLWYCEH